MSSFNKMTHRGPTRTKHNVWGCNLPFSGCSRGGEGRVQAGRRSGCESQDVLSGWALGSGPPMPVTHEAGKWRKSGIALSEALLSPF